MNNNGVTQKRHDFLVDSQTPGSEYTKGKTIGGKKVFATVKEMGNKFSEIFITLPSGLQIITPKNSFLYQDCHVFLGVKKEKEGPSSGAFLGTIIITGRGENIKKVENILENNFPTITQ